MLDFTTELKERGIGFRVLAFPEIDTTGPFGTALLTILGALAQMERDVLAERVQDGLAAARARGRTGGCGFVRLVAGFLQRSVAVLLPRSRRTGCR
jgi:DNA invertase Pin-like site-specific DNA recombinase